MLNIRDRIIASAKRWQTRYLKKSHKFGIELSKSVKQARQIEELFPNLAEELEPISEVGDHYIGTEIFLPRGDQMARGHVVSKSRDVNGNVMGRSHTNPIMYMRMYQVEFTL